MPITYNQVQYQEINTVGADVPMSELIISQEGIHTTGVYTCYAVGIYGTTTEGVAQLLLCHADATMGEGNGEQVVADCIQAFGAVQEGTQEIFVVAGSVPTSQYYQAASVATSSFIPPTPEPAPIGWMVDVAMLPDGVVNWAAVDFVTRPPR